MSVSETANRGTSHLTIISPRRAASRAELGQRRAVADVAAVVVVFVVVVTVALVVGPIGRAAACDVGPTDVPSLSILPSDLPTILQSDGTWAERYKAVRTAEGIDATPPRFVGAGKREVVEYYPETATHYDGATWKMIAAWGTFSVKPAFDVGREEKGVGGAPCSLGTYDRVGDSAYWLETDDGSTVDVNTDGADMTAIEVELVTQFGAVTFVTDEMVAEATSEESRGQQSSGVTTDGWATESILTGFGIAVGITVLAVLLGGRTG